jgi:hypothetical protein
MNEGEQDAALFARSRNRECAGARALNTASAREHAADRPALVRVSAPTRCVPGPPRESWLWSASDCLSMRRQQQEDRKPPRFGHCHSRKGPAHQPGSGVKRGKFREETATAPRSGGTTIRSCCAAEEKPRQRVGDYGARRSPLRQCLGALALFRWINVTQLLPRRWAAATFY